MSNKPTTSGYLADLQRSAQNLPTETSGSTPYVKRMLESAREGDPKLPLYKRVIEAAKDADRKKVRGPRPEGYRRALEDLDLVGVKVVDATYGIGVIEKRKGIYADVRFSCVWASPEENTVVKTVRLSSLRLLSSLPRI